MCQQKEQVLVVTSTTESSGGSCSNGHDKQRSEGPAVLKQKSKRTTTDRCSCFKETTNINENAAVKKRCDKIVALDMDETLIHSLFISDNDVDSGRYRDEAGFFIDDGEGRHIFVRERPGLHAFLQKLSQHHEIHIFTAATQDYADQILDTLEGSDQIGRYFTKRWYRNDCTPMIQLDETGEYSRFRTKNLAKITKDFSRILLVDDFDDNFLFQPQNGYRIPSFYGDSDDMELHQLEEYITRMDCQPDVRMWQYQALHLKNDQCHYLPDFARQAGPPRSFVMNRGLSRVPSQGSSYHTDGTHSGDDDDNNNSLYKGRYHSVEETQQLAFSGIVVKMVQYLTC